MTRGPGISVFITRNEFFVLEIRDFLYFYCVFNSGVVIYYNNNRKSYVTFITFCLHAHNMRASHFPQTMKISETPPRDTRF